MRIGLPREKCTGFRCGILEQKKKLTAEEFLNLAQLEGHPVGGEADVVVVGQRVHQVLRAGVIPVRRFRLVAGHGTQSKTVIISKRINGRGQMCPGVVEGLGFVDVT